VTFDKLIQRARVGDLLFFSGRSWWSRLIRLRTAAKWSHVGIVSHVEKSNRPGGNLVLITEALEGKGVVTQPADVWRFWNGTVALGCVARTDAVRKTVAEYAKGQEKCLYASPRQFIRSFSFLWAKLTRAMDIPADVNERRWFCSELAAAALNITGTVDLPKDPARMQPGDLADLSFVSVTDGVPVPC